MRGVIVLVIAVLVLSACTVSVGTSSSRPRRNQPNRKAPTTSSKVVNDICAKLTAGTVSNLLGTKVNSTAASSNQCKYTGIANGRQFAVEVVHNTKTSSGDTKYPTDKAIPGLGSSALLSGTQLKVRVRAQESVTIWDGSSVAGEHGMVKMAKELLPKL